MKMWTRVLGVGCAVGLLLGMANAQASSVFLDAQDITYIAEVARAAEEGLFVGTDGKFQPKGSVTRAQMATIIVKMLHGSDYNADAHKGTGRFPDTAEFESGWAEGYINLCAQDGVVAGYGDGTFQPGNRVTAAEAVTMLLNAKDIDAGAGEWPATVMGKAKEMKLFQQLNEELQSDTPLNREQLAVLIVAMLDWQEAQSTPSGGGSSGGSSSGGSSSGGSSSGGSSSGGSSSGGSSSGGGSVSDDVEEKEPVLGVEAGTADLAASNVFLLSAVLSEDGTSVDVTLELKGEVLLCGFDMTLLYDPEVYSLRELDTEHDLAIYAHAVNEDGQISFNYAGATNIKKEKVVLTAGFDVVGEIEDSAVFSLRPEEVIVTDEQGDYSVVPTEYVLTYCLPRNK